ncbi:MAG TPA: DUF4058 family protein [Chloroflexi bacterium]|nr:DUF4058 family protein [Chloroflexota bacterium]
MPSPFPGMDPYLEALARWTDVHQRLITYIADALQSQVRPDYHARMGERVYVVAPHHTFYPDVLVVQHPAREMAPVYVEAVVDEAAPADEVIEADGDAGGVEDVEVEAETRAEPDDAPLPLIVRLDPAEYREPYVEIVHTAGDEVVTVIEMLSPANKASGPGRDLYRRKQAQILDSPVNLIEIDLLSTGQPTVALPIEVVAGLPAHRYLIGVRRAAQPDQAEVYPIPLSRRLPAVNVPLREPDPDVVLDLQALFTRCYDNGGYGDLIDYRQPPPIAPMLEPEEAAWIDGLLRGRGLRPE